MTKALQTLHRIFLFQYLFSTTSPLLSQLSKYKTQVRFNAVNHPSFYRPSVKVNILLHGSDSRRSAPMQSNPIQPRLNVAAKILISLI